VVVAVPHLAVSAAAQEGDEAFGALADDVAAGGVVADGEAVDEAAGDVVRHRTAEEGEAHGWS
jgi:hypothetical protein